MAGEKHLYVVAQGDYTDTALSTERWQVGLRFIAVPGNEPDPVGPIANTWDPVADTIARVEADWRIDGNWRVEGGISDLNVDDWLNDQLAPAFGVWLQQAAISSVCRLQAIKVYPIGAPDGNAVPAPPYSTGSPITLQWTSNFQVGGGSSTLMPLQVSIVASHRTAQIGRRGRGRMFLPGIPTAAMSTAGSGKGTLASGYISGPLAAQVQLLQDCALDGTATGFWCRPAIIGSPWTSYATISQVQLGNVADTQRRRRAQLDETYSSTAVAY